MRDCIDDLRLAIDSLASSGETFAVMAGKLRSSTPAPPRSRSHSKR